MVEESFRSFAAIMLCHGRLLFLCLGPLLFGLFQHSVKLYGYSVVVLRVLVQGPPLCSTSLLQRVFWVG